MIEHFPDRHVLIDSIVRKAIAREGGVSRFRTWKSIDDASIRGSAPEILGSISRAWLRECKEIIRYVQWLRYHAKADNRSIRDIKLRRPLIRCLEAGGCVTINDVVTHMKNDTLTSIHGIGRKSDIKIRTALNG